MASARSSLPTIWRLPDALWAILAAVLAEYRPALPDGTATALTNAKPVTELSTVCEPAVSGTRFLPSSAMTSVSIAPPSNIVLAFQHPSLREEPELLVL